MDPIYKPLTKEEKEKLNNRGLKEFEYMRMANWADPESNAYIISSIALFFGSLYGRHFCKKNHIPGFIFSLNIVLLPIFYFAAFKFKHVDRHFSSTRARPTFNQCLEFYPVTRRAWNRALVQRDQEMKEIKNAVGELKHDA